MEANQIERLKEIDEKRSELYSKIRELSQEEFRIKYQGIQEKAEGCIGKFYKSKPTDPRETILFAPKEVVLGEHKIDIFGLYIKGATFSDNNKLAYIETRYSMRAPEFLDTYEEIDEEVFKSELADIIDIID